MKHRFAFVVVLSFFLSIPFFSFSAFGFAGDEEKKVLYFHVGAPKTATKAIQYECSERREELAKLGVNYPPSENGVNHSVEILKIFYGKAEETKEWILKVKEQSKDFKSILLSDECASMQSGKTLLFQEFLTFLNQHFAVKYIYCFRKTVPAIGSLLTMNIIRGSVISNDALNIDEHIKFRMLRHLNSYDFYSRLDTTLLSYEELAKSGKLVQTFLYQAMGLKIEIPNRLIHTIGDYDREVNFTDTQLIHLERAFSVEEGSFVIIYRKPDPTLELSKVLSSLIRERTKKILSTPEFHMGEFSPYPTNGFSDCEFSHRWTERTKASVTVPLAEMDPLPSRISFLNTSGLVTDNHTQDLTVKVNEEVVGSYIYTLNNNNQIIDIPLPKVDRAKIEFDIPNAISPFNLGINADKRTLGISFKEVQLQY
ncbi:MAG: hypothetical protein K2X02_04100 [Alphaproteobacteria bacterium]|nr:hypothetical protein [Alphaproteobacteria bacterium]